MDLHDVSEELLRRRIFEIDVSLRVWMLLNRCRHIQFRYEVAKSEVKRLVTGQF
jgi:hypothetical protein